MRHRNGLIVVALASGLTSAACDSGMRPAGFGGPCIGNADCASGLCLILPEGSTCTRSCVSDCDCPTTHTCAAVTATQSVCAPGPSTCGTDAGMVEPPDAGPPDAGTAPVCTISAMGPLLPAGEVDVGDLCIDFSTQTCLRISHDDCLDDAMPSYGNPVVFLRRRTTGEYLIAANTEYINTSIDSVSHGYITGRTAYAIPADTDVSFVASWTGGQFRVVVRFSGSSVTILDFGRYTGG